MIYILAALISVSLAVAQTQWGSAVKAISTNQHDISALDLITSLLRTGKFWIGALLYVVGTILYFLLLSKVRFFSVQLTMTGLAIILSVAISFFYFRETISALNILGVFLVFMGIILVIRQ